MLLVILAVIQIVLLAVFVILFLTKGGVTCGIPFQSC